MKRWGALALIAVLTGCTVNREAGRQDVTEMAQVRVGQPVASQAAPTSPRIEGLLKADLTLTAAIDVALHQNPALMAAYGRFGIAQADLAQAGLVSNPNLGVSMRLPHQPNSDVGWQASVSQEFLDMLLLPLRQRVAKAEFDRAKAELAQDVFSTAIDVQKAYVGVQAAQQLVAMRRIVLDAAQAAAELAERQKAAGNISALDLAVQQSQYQEAKLDLARDELHVVAQREQLNRLMGVWGPQTTWALASRLPEPPADELPLDRLESLAIAQRLDIAAARQEVTAVSEALNLIRASRLSNSVEIGATSEHDIEGDSGTGPDLRVEVPIFNQRQASVGRLESQLQASKSRLDQLAVDARSEVRTTRLNLMTQRQTVQYYKTVLIPLKEKITSESQRYYNAMLLGAFPLLQAKQAEVNTYRDYLAAVRDYWLIRADLGRVLGGPPAVPGPTGTTTTGG